ncbi:Lysylphosphatidylglycerol synthase TM region [uncultured archaeon]|nr:Lysylphosphatidylglycerol synthase TM region [uncultured archaeon]
MKRIKFSLIKLIFSILVTFVILYFLFAQLGISNLALLITSPYIFLLTLILFPLIELINVFRYARAFEIKFNLKLFSLSNFANMVVGIMPMRVGEISYVYGLKKYFEVNYANGVKKLFLVRIADLLVIYILLITSSLFVAVSIAQEIIYFVSILFLAAFLGLGIFSIIAAKYSVSKRLKKYPKISKLVLIIEESVLEAFKIKKRKLALIFILSLVYWLLRLLMGFAVLYALGVQLDFFVISFIGLALLFIDIIPIRTVANFGIFEAGFAYFLVQLGYGYAFALNKTLIFHIAIFIPTIIYGLIGYALLKLDKQKTSKTKTSR